MTISSSGAGTGKLRDAAWRTALELLQTRAKMAMPMSNDDAAEIFRLYASTGQRTPTAYWAILLAQVYKSETHAFTDVGKAHRLLVEAALKNEPDSSAAAFNLAIDYMSPMNGQGLDNKRAMLWLSKASVSTDQATELMIELIETRSELAPLRSRIPELLNNMQYSLSNPSEHRTYAGLLKARQFNGGLFGTPIDQERAQAFYHAVAKRNVNWHAAGPHLNVARKMAAQAAATRSLFGIGIPINVDAAAAYANDLLSCCDRDNIHDADERYAAQRILGLVEFMRPPKLKFLGCAAYNGAPTIQSVTNGILAREITPKDLEWMITTSFRATKHREGWLWLLNQYLANELSGYPNYANSLALMQAGLLGKWSIKSVPNEFRYNVIDSDKRPILGAIEKPSSERISSNGFGKFRGFNVTATGEINFEFDPADSKQLPLLVPEDIEVALALAFSVSRPIWPRFSADPPAPSTPTSPKWIPFAAKWDPPWLGHTLLGNTLFATDCEAGPLMLWDIAKLQIATAHSEDSSLVRLKHVIDKMAAVIPRDHGFADFLTFKVAAVELAWTQGSDRQLRCRVDAAKVGLHTGTTDEYHTRTYTNNTDYATGYRAAIFNANYDLFAEHYPLLERYRQIATLVTALNQLRERGFEPAEPIRRAITESYHSFVRRPAPTQAKQLFL